MLSLYEPKLGGSHTRSSSRRLILPLRAKDLTEAPKEKARPATLISTLLEASEIDQMCFSTPSRNSWSHKYVLRGFTSSRAFCRGTRCNARSQTPRQAPMPRIWTLLLAFSLLVACGARLAFWIESSKTNKSRYFRSNVCASGVWASHSHKHLSQLDCPLTVLFCDFFS